MTTLLIDASVALKWFIEEPESDAAGELLLIHADFHAPELLQVELANAFCKNARRGRIAPDAWRDSLPRLIRMFQVWHPNAPLLVDAVEISLASSHPVYDCVYLALARQLGAPCLTADRKLLGTIQDTPYAGLAIDFLDWREPSVLQ